ncbi:Hypothetical_protein [Hexamita inflata]|uniref:Hypothetical_protein n=1 Tax=Hexamita inflata TaxID=28002 RepID=A0AA86QVD4_9EUKA|nr:Hypothetical protein HINF_LOCUS49871 [Hexamita inflata]
MNIKTVSDILTKYHGKYNELIPQLTQRNFKNIEDYNNYQQTLVMLQHTPNDEQLLTQLHKYVQLVLNTSKDFVYKQIDNTVVSYQQLKQHFFDNYKISTEDELVQKEINPVVQFKAQKMEKLNAVLNKQIKDLENKENKVQEKAKIHRKIGTNWYIKKSVQW